jgi:hypothetical protein
LTVRAAAATTKGAVVMSTGQRDARGTQSFVQILAMCWRRPSLLGLELLWRWAFGIPLMAGLGWAGWHIWLETAARVRATGVFDFSLLDPMQGAMQIAAAVAVLRGPVLHAVEWLLPSGIALAAVAGGLGRNAVLRRYKPELPWKPAAMIALQLLRMVALVGSFVAWFALIRWSASVSLSDVPAQAGVASEPNLVEYCALVIVVSLGMFTVWALLSWVFSIAPLLTVLEGRGVGGSLARSVRLGPLTGKLVEINLVMGIVKLALIVLAMVFSAVPLPFEAQVQGNSLYAWWAVVTVLYMLASDFFQVARVVAYVELWGLAGRAGQAVPAAASEQIRG